MRNFIVLDEDGLYIANRDAANAAAALAQLDPIAVRRLGLRAVERDERRGLFEQIPAYQHQEQRA